MLLNQHLRKTLIIPVIDRQIDFTLMRFNDFYFLPHVPAPISLYGFAGAKILYSK
jgi:hypothetical protein